MAAFVSERNTVFVSPRLQVMIVNKFCAMQPVQGRLRIEHHGSYPPNEVKTCPPVIYVKNERQR